MIDALGGDQPRAEMKQFDREKDQTRVAGGLKAYVFLLSWKTIVMSYDMLMVLQSNSEPPEFGSGQESSTGEASTDGRAFRVAQCIWFSLYMVLLM